MFRVLWTGFARARNHASEFRSGSDDAPHPGVREPGTFTPIAASRHDYRGLRGRSSAFVCFELCDAAILIRTNVIPKNKNSKAGMKRAYPSPEGIQILLCPIIRERTDGDERADG